MPGQHIWHIKARRVGQADYEIAEIQLDRRRAPVHGEVIDVVVKRESIRAKVVSFNESTSGSTTTYTVLATEEDDGNPPDHREATAKDFEQ
jgi:hypothetical protein